MTEHILQQADGVEMNLPERFRRFALSGEDAPRPEGETADEGGEVRARKRQKAILEEDD